MQVPLDQEGDRTQNCTRSHTQHKGCRRGVRIKRVTGCGERARIRIHHSHKKPIHPGHPIKSYNFQIQAFLHFINLSHSSSVEVLTRGLIGACARCRPFKNVTPRISFSPNFCNTLGMLHHVITQFIFNRIAWN